MAKMLAENRAFSLEVEDGIALLRFRKAFLNVALDLHTRGEFLKQMDVLENDPDVLGLIQINDEEFSGEAEISAFMQELSHKSHGDLSVLHRFKRSTFQIMSRNLEFAKPLVSGVIGNMTLDEFGVALLCDRVVLSDDCHVRNVSVDVGLPAGPVLTYFLPRVVGPKRAVTLLTNVEPFGAAEAIAFGLADNAVPRAELVGECRAALLRLAKVPEPVVTATRKLIFSQFDKFEEHAELSLKLAVKILQSRSW